MTQSPLSLFERIGPDRIAAVIRRFYDLAFEDPMIQHFFIHSDKEHIVREQITFASAMLGGPRAYQGLPLATAHDKHQIRPPHFRRRQILMRETLDALGVAGEDRDAWLRMEESLRPLIMGDGAASCGVPPHLRGNAAASES